MMRKSQRSKEKKMKQTQNHDLAPVWKMKVFASKTINKQIKKKKKKKHQ